MQIPQQYESAESFERWLGDPADQASRVSFATALELDEAEEYPTEQHRLLDSWELPEMYIPAAYGGRLRSFEEVFALLRVLSRRDLTVALSHGITFLGALPTWLAGSDEQKRALAGLIGGRRKVAFALTERTHGADLLANEFEARQDAGRYLISGEKWLIGNATRAEAITLFARTRPEGGPRGFSLIVANKELLDPATFHHLPKVPTVGLRGADLSGIFFNGSAVPESARIGSSGSGLELALKTLQITRTLVTGMSLGAADTALRLALDFALERRIYGGSVLAIPHARASLYGAFLDIMICDCVAIAAARALQVRPEQAAMWSAATKYFVPSRLDGAMRDLSVVMGARFFLRSGHPWCMFQKVIRDSSIVSVFEGTGVVQLHALGLQLEQMTTSRVPEDDLNRSLKTIFSLTEPLPSFEPRKMDLISRDGCDPVSGIPMLRDQVRSAGVSEAVTVPVESLFQRSRELISDIGLAQRSREGSSGMLELARRYTHIHAGACCVAFWLYNRRTLGHFFGREEWLADALNRLFAVEPRLQENEPLGREAVERHSQNRLFSAIPIQLAL